MSDLIRSELLRIWSRRMVRVLAVVAVIGATAGVTIGAIQSHPPDLATAQRNYEDDQQHCLAGDFVPEDQLPPGETLEGFCADNVRLENYVNDSLRLAELSGILKGTAFILIVLGLVIGASSVGADWQVGTMAALLTWEPRRVRIFLVRAAVVLGSVFVLAVALQCVLALEFAAAAALRGTTVGTGGPWFREVAGTVVRIGVASAFGASLGCHPRDDRQEHGRRAGRRVRVPRDRGEPAAGFIPKISTSLLSTNLVVLVDGRPGRSETGSLIVDVVSASTRVRS